MVLSVIGSILGFCTSFVPQLIGLWKDKLDHQHEVEMATIQMEMSKLGHTQKMEEINVQADIAESQAVYAHAKQSGTKWVDAFAGTIRPILTYSFFLMYAVIKYAQFCVLKTAYDTGTTVAGILTAMWTDVDMAIFCTIVSFWFGGRAMQKYFPKR